MFVLTASRCLELGPAARIEPNEDVPHPPIYPHPMAIHCAMFAPSHGLSCRAGGVEIHGRSKCDSDMHSCVQMPFRDAPHMESILWLGCADMHRVGQQHEVQSHSCCAYLVDRDIACHVPRAR